MVRIVTETANETEKQRARAPRLPLFGRAHWPRNWPLPQPRLGTREAGTAGGGADSERNAANAQPSSGRRGLQTPCAAFAPLIPQFSSSPRWARSPSGCGARSNGSTMRMTVRYTAELQRYMRSAGVSAGRRAVRHRRGFHHDRSLQRADTRRRQVLLDAGGEFRFGEKHIVDVCGWGCGKVGAQGS